jgi:hypothetical protein
VSCVWLNVASAMASVVLPSLCAAASKCSIPRELVETMSEFVAGWL